MDSLQQTPTITEPVYTQMRVIIYARVSKDEQNKKGKASIETQVKEMSKEAIRKNWKIVYIAEEDCEGWNEFRDRPEGGKVMTMLENDEADIVMLWDNDRLARDEDTVVAKIARRDFRMLYIQVYSLHQPIEIKPREIYEPYAEDSSLWVESATDTASSVSIRQLRRRHDMGMRKRTENGLITGTPPTGYKVIMVRKAPNSIEFRQKRVGNKDYIPVVKDIFDMYEKGQSFMGIVRQLNIKGIKTPPRFSKEGKVLLNGDRLWTATTIKGIINNPVYYGASVYYKDKSIKKYDKDRRKYVTKRIHQPMDKWLIVEKGEHPKIIEKEQWLRCQEIKKSKAKYGRTYGESYLLSGLCKCGHCRYSMHRSGGWGGGYVECDRHLKTGKTQCQTNSYRILHLEKYVLNYLYEISKDPNILPHLKIKKGKKDIKTLELSLDSLRVSIKNGEKAKDKIHEFMENGIYDPIIGKERLIKQDIQIKSLSAEVDRVRTKIMQLSQQQRVKETVLEVLNNFQERFKKLPLKHQKVLLRTLLKEVLVFTNKKTKEKSIEVIFNLD